MFYFIKFTSQESSLSYIKDLLTLFLLDMCLLQHEEIYKWILSRGISLENPKSLLLLKLLFCVGLHNQIWYFSLMFYNPLYLISRKQSSFLLFSLFILVYWIKDNHMWFTWIEVFLTHSCRSIKSFKEFPTSFMTKSYFFHSFLWLLTQVFDWQYILWVFHWSIYTFQFLYRLFYRSKKVDFLLHPTFVKNEISIISMIYRFFF